VIWLDQGKIFQAGPTPEVAGAYEVSMTNRSDGMAQAKGAPEIQNGFVCWEIVEPRAENPNVLTTPGPVHLKFVLRLNKPVTDGHHGIALFNHEHQLMWGWATRNLQLAEGIHEFHYSFPTLPLRPGLYNWLVSLYDQGHQLDVWPCVPEMAIATEIHQDLRDEWNGILNVPCVFGIQSSENATMVEAAERATRESA